MNVKYKKIFLLVIMVISSLAFLFFGYYGIAAIIALFSYNKDMMLVPSPLTFPGVFQLAGIAVFLISLALCIGFVILGIKCFIRYRRLVKNGI